MRTSRLDRNERQGMGKIDSPRRGAEISQTSPQASRTTYKDNGGGVTLAKVPVPRPSSQMDGTVSCLPSAWSNRTFDQRRTRCWMSWRWERRRPISREGCPLLDTCTSSARATQAACEWLGNCALHKRVIGWAACGPSASFSQGRKASFWHRAPTITLGISDV